MTKDIFKGSADKGKTVKPAVSTTATGTASCSAGRSVGMQPRGPRPPEPKPPFGMPAMPIAASIKVLPPTLQTVKTDTSSEGEE